LITKYLSFCEYVENDDKETIINDLTINIVDAIIKNLKLLDFNIKSEKIKNNFPTLIFEGEKEYKDIEKKLTDEEKKYLEINGCYLIKNQKNILIKEFRLTSITQEISKFIFEKITNQLEIKNQSEISENKIKDIKNIFATFCSRFILPEKYGQQTFLMDEQSDKNADYIFKKIFLE